MKIPAHLSLEEGATLPCAGVTVWHAMIEHARAAPIDLRDADGRPLENLRGDGHV